MFKERLLTALILIPLILAILVFGNLALIAFIIFLLILACGYEWMQLVPLKQTLSKLAFFLALVSGCYLIQLYFKYWLLVGIDVWGLIAIFIVTYPRSKRFWGHKWVVALFCFFLLPLFGKSMLEIFQMPEGRGLMIYLLALVWAADIGAYLVGKYCGRHKLIPKVSPGKTWEGVLGGLGLTVAISLFAYYYFSRAFILSWIGLACGVFVFALVGDLFISLLKRRSNIKDTGQLLPGHGGILDRLDSLIAAAPFFCWVIQKCC